VLRLNVKPVGVIEHTIISFRHYRVGEDKFAAILQFPINGRVPDHPDAVRIGDENRPLKKA
jgi:hypothetical protein